MIRLKFPWQVENLLPPEWFDLDRGEKMRVKTWIWMDMDDENAIYESEQAYDDRSDPKCPKCNERSNWDEGTIDQDFQGNDIRGWWYVCYGCNLSTAAIEGDYHEQLD